jgi:hypothetical protein
MVENPLYRHSTIAKSELARGMAINNAEKQFDAIRLLFGRGPALPDWAFPASSHRLSGY